MALQGRFPNSAGNFQHLYSISGLEHWGQEDTLKQAASAALEHCTHHYKSHKKKIILTVRNSQVQLFFHLFPLSQAHQNQYLPDTGASLCYHFHPSFNLP